MEEIIKQAENNLLALEKNPYPGRGIVVGIDEKGENLIQIYWIMGRSPKSRNRIFIPGESQGSLKTALADPSLVGPDEDTSLIIYKAMDHALEVYAVSNGAQTSAALSFGALDDENGGLMNPKFIDDWEYEPDSPNFTPRITALTFLNNANPIIQMSLFKKSPWDKTCDYYFYKLAVPSLGLGYCITTYSGDGNPLPAFSGDPYLLPIKGNSAEKIGENFWNILNPENKVSLAVNKIDILTGVCEIKIFNKYQSNIKF